MLNKQRELYKNYLHLEMEKYYKVLKNWLSWQPWLPKTSRQTLVTI